MARRATRRRSPAARAKTAIAPFRFGPHRPRDAVPHKRSAIIEPARARASPSKMMKRQGASLPWSGTRAPICSSVSTSAALGPGPLRAAGGAERRAFSISIVEFMAASSQVHVVRRKRFAGIKARPRRRDKLNSRRFLLMRPSKIALEQAAGNPAPRRLRRIERRSQRQGGARPRLRFRSGRPWYRTILENAV